MMLCGVVSKEEFKNTLFQLHSDKALGPNEFTKRFFQTCWIFFGDDVWKLVEDFQRTKSFVRDLSNSLITLVLKKI